MTREELREKVAKAMKLAADDPSPVRYWYAEADAAIAIVLEEAAKVAEGIKATIYDDDLIEVGRLQACKEVAAAIRALGKQP